MNLTIKDHQLDAFIDICDQEYRMKLTQEEAIEVLHWLYDLMKTIYEE